MMRLVLFVHFVTFLSLASLPAQTASPPQVVGLPKAVYTPKPEYRPEWAKQGLTGKGVVLVSIDSKTGSVTGVRMLQSTGNQLLDGAALQAYSQWRFEPGSVPQVKMPIEFASRPPSQASNKNAARSTISYLLIILIAFAAGAIAFRKRRRT
ncbi:MAG TPA: energy transducer TonB [Chthoniobacterales bacterium]|jgi:TonB family protein|nr:energy transducer TonB [Chthoniobacterales bacterium]